jgi:DNA (cytosine-5)-methyltransferase 1
MSLGAIQAGIDVRLAVESDPHAASTYAYNHPNTRVFADNIEKLIEVEIDRGGKCTVLFGGAPCQGFSTSNQKTRKADNPINWLFLEFLRVT